MAAMLSKFPRAQLQNLRAASTGYLDWVEVSTLSPLNCILSEFKIFPIGYAFIMVLENNYPTLRLGDIPSAPDNG